MDDRDKYLKLSIDLTTKYLEEYPENASRYCKTKEKQIANIKKNFNKIIAPNEPTTKPDILVSRILESLFDHELSRREKIQKQYNDQKQTEMMIGELLERYISQKGQVFGWAFSGECIKAVDFIKKDGDQWIKLQIKTSDNTENSSAKAIRDDTPIKKWFRRFSSPQTKTPVLKKNGKLSKKGLTDEEYQERLISGDLSTFTQPDYNWDNFPDDDLKKVLSEEGFIKFIDKHIETIKNDL